MLDIRPIPGYGDNYAVSSNGEVYRVKKSKNSKPGPLSPSIVAGYPRVSLSHNGVVKNIHVHRLIGVAFLGLTDDLVINHKNGVKTDNRLENLEVCSQAENNRHMVNVLKKWNKNLTKLTESQVLEIRRLHKEGMPQRAIAPLFNVLFTNICHIVNRKTWKHI